jgi:[acyl-carrier-protein] S-malonyltransferase
VRAGIGLLFPGQGAQFVGMGKELADMYPAAKALFDLADSIMEVPLSRVMWQGPEELLKQTKFTQPAILVHSLAVLKVAREHGFLDTIAAAAGHSLGEYSALVAAGVLTPEDALVLVRRRAELMQEAGELRVGTMAAVIGLDPSQMENILGEARSEGIVVAANVNSPDQIVLSGEERAVKAAEELAREHGAKRVIRLVVSGAFHSPLMSGVARSLAPLVETTEFLTPNCPVVPNATATPTIDAAEIRRALLLQIESPVRWWQSFTAMIEAGATRFVEIGPGRVLAGLAKRINRNIPVGSVGDSKAVESLAQFCEG